MLKSSKVNPADIISVTIGTTVSTFSRLYSCIDTREWLLWITNEGPWTFPASKRELCRSFNQKKMACLRLWIVIISKSFSFLITLLAHYMTKTDFFNKQHFVNAVVEMDMTRLTPVAIIRLCSGFGKHAPPGVDWPDDMRTAICSYYALVKGGLQGKSKWVTSIPILQHWIDCWYVIQVDGDLINDIDEEEIQKECMIIKERGINSIVVVGVFKRSVLVQLSNHYYQIVIWFCQRMLQI
jgi:hypothetical protein